MQSRCNLGKYNLQFRFNRDVNQTYCFVLYSYLTFTDRVGVGGWGVVGEMGNKAISSFNSVEVEVEDELGKSVA